MVIYSNLGDLYLEKERFQDAAETYEAFVNQDPYHPKAPVLQDHVIEAYKQGGFPSLVLEGKESFVERYPEIDRVSYFGKDGAALFYVGNDQDMEHELVEDLDESRPEDAVEVIGQKKPYLMHSGFLNPRQFEILAPVWTESMAEEDLFGFDAESADAGTQTQLLGFVGIHLDFMIFHDRLLANIKSAVFVLLILIFVLALFGRRALRRALSSISDLQAPIQELAKGNLGVKFNPAAHREISDIVEALETTATALSERDAKLVEMANHDALTGLFNRRRFVEELKKETAAVMRRGHMSALLFVDLDQFKYINDSCGHQAGDRLIRKVADELTRSVRGDDVVARRVRGLQDPFQLARRSIEHERLDVLARQRACNAHESESGLPEK